MCGNTHTSYDYGATVQLLLVTLGEHGSSDPLLHAQEVATRREEEARKTAKIFGIAEVLFLHYSDGNVEDTHALRADLVEWIRRWQPSVWFTIQSAPILPISLRDHRIVGPAVLDAVYPLARDHLVFTEQMRAGLSPHKVGEVWLFTRSSADTYVVSGS